MPCACSVGKKSATGTKYTVKYSTGATYKTYSNKVEADAAAKRIGGKVSTS